MNTTTTRTRTRAIAVVPKTIIIVSIPVVWIVLYQFVLTSKFESMIYYVSNTTNTIPKKNESNNYNSTTVSNDNNFHHHHDHQSYYFKNLSFFVSEKQQRTIPPYVLTSKIVPNKNCQQHYSFDGNGNMDRFFYVHIPKTGTNLYRLLRNLIPLCFVKDFTCFGMAGGGLYKEHSADGRKHIMYKKKNMIKNKGEINTCNYRLNCKLDDLYHCPYDKCQNQKNKVTMLREPYAWFNSIFKWKYMFHIEDIYRKNTDYLKNSNNNNSNNNNNTSTISFIDPKSVILNFGGNYPYLSQMEFVTGIKDDNEDAIHSNNNSNSKNDTITTTTKISSSSHYYHDDDTAALTILEQNYIFWGITDHWNTSVCLFYCEMDGTSIAFGDTTRTKASGINYTADNMNVRSYLPLRKLSSIESKLPKEYHMDAIVPNTTRFVIDHYHRDIPFYHNVLIPIFQKRAAACDCPL